MIQEMECGYRKYGPLVSQRESTSLDAADFFRCIRLCPVATAFIVGADFIPLSAPQEATAVIPQGTIQEYQSYQTVINSAVLKSAEAAEAHISGNSVQGNIGIAGGAFARRDVSAAVGWLSVVVGIVGAGIGIVGL